MTEPVDPSTASVLPVELDGRVTALVDECRSLVDGFEAAGHRLYVVGGIVRDLLDDGELDDPDFDFTTDATPDVVKAIVGPIADAVWNQGERFGTIAAKFGPRLFEVTTHRAEAYDPESRKPDVVFSDDVLVDLSRRDFTINAMAIELTAPSPRLIDPFDGAADLRARRLRTPLAPTVSFSDDPLRMLRAARFVARMGLDPDPDVVGAIVSMRERLAVVSVERIRVELDKLLGCADPSAGTGLLVQTGLVDSILPELGGRADLVGGVRPDPILRMAVLLAAGTAETARRRMRGLKHARHDIDRVTRLVGLVEWSHGRVADGPHEHWTDPELRQVALRAGDARADLLALLRADLAAPDPALDAMSLDALDGGLVDLALREDLDAIESPLDGSSVMAQLGIPAGRDVGAALAFLLEERVTHGPMGRDDAAARLARWWSER